METKSNQMANNIYQFILFGKLPKKKTTNLFTITCLGEVKLDLLNLHNYINFNICISSRLLFMVQFLLLLCFKFGV